MIWRAVRGVRRPRRSGTPLLAGPAILGWLVHTYVVQKAMLLPFALSFVLVVITKWTPAIERGTAADHSWPGPLPVMNYRRWLKNHE